MYLWICVSDFAMDSRNHNHAFPGLLLILYSNGRIEFDITVLYRNARLFVED